MNVRLGAAPRLWIAALLCLVPLGLVWSATSGYLTVPYYNPGTCDYAEPGTYCTPESYTPGTYVPGTSLHGYSTAPRIFLAAAFVAFLVAAIGRRSATTLRIARLGCLSAAAAAALAAANRASGSLIVLIVALLLTVPVVWPASRRRRILASRQPAG